MAAPTILAYGNDEQRQRWLRKLWTAEEIWCQLFSEPGAGSDLAALATRAVRDGDEWVVNGQKVWTSQAHQARRALLVTRTDPDVPKHQGLTYFSVDMTAPGVEVRPLRQATGEAEFNEVFLTDVRIPDTDRIGQVGEGWKVANATLMSERVSIGASRAAPREGGMIASAARTWRSRPELRTPGLHDRMLRLWADAEVARLAGERLRQQLAAGQPGPEGSAAKLVFARLNQEISGFEVELAGADGLRYDDWTMRRPEQRQLLRPRPRVPLPARQGQLHRGRDLGDPAQHRRRAGARPPLRTPRGQGRAMEGPAQVSGNPGAKRICPISSTQMPNGRCRTPWLPCLPTAAAWTQCSRASSRPRPTTTSSGRPSPPTWAAPGC